MVHQPWLIDGRSRPRICRSVCFSCYPHSESSRWAIYGNTDPMMRLFLSIDAIWQSFRPLCGHTNIPVVCTQCHTWQCWLAFTSCKVRENCMGRNSLRWARTMLGPIDECYHMRIHQEEDYETAWKKRLSLTCCEKIRLANGFAKHFFLFFLMLA